jgi:DNA transposition AAA+ family ATPase
MNKSSPFIPELENILSRVETILDTGYLLDRLIGQTGIPESHIKKLMDRQNIGYTNSDSRKQDEAFSALREWLEIHESSERPDSFAATPTFEKIQAIIANAHRTGDFVAITGDVGIGKSCAAIEYVKANPRGFNKPGALRVEFTRAERNDTAALQAILGALVGEVEIGRSAYRNGNMMNAICRELDRRDCLILDECNYLGASIDIARDIYDKSGAAIILIGNPELSNAIWNKKRQDFSALASRTTRFDFPRTLEQDVEAFLTWKGITGARIRKIAVEVAARPGQSGGLRTLTKILALREKYYPGLNMDADTFEALAAQIGRV